MPRQTGSLCCDAVGLAVPGCGGRETVSTDGSVCPQTICLLGSREPAESPSWNRQFPPMGELAAGEQGKVCQDCG